MKRYILFLFISLLTFSLHAQNIDVTGTVIGESDQEPIIGAYVKVKGSTAGAVTDLNGTYMLKGVSGKATLVISCVGYATQEIPVKDRHTLNITLKDEASDLNEVVVIGYGAVKKGDLTSSISAIKGDKLEHMSTGNVMNALQGQVNGVQISNAGGPGASPRVIIRGISTINGSDPLYVVDGMPVGTNINFLNQNDIESMQVLKDASASAIYGTRDSNGVILITTKKGAAGKTKFNASATWGFQTLSKPDIAGADEYRQVFNTRYTNDGHTSIFNETSDDGRSSLGNTDWWDETMRDVALQQNYNFGFSGGNDKYIYSASIGYYRQDSQYKTGNWQKLSARFSMEYNFNKIVKAGIDFTPRYENWDDTPSLLGAIMAMDPTTPVMNDEDKWVSNPYSNYARSHNNQEWNPVASMNRLDSGADEYALLATPFVQISPIKGLTFRTQFGVNARFRMTNSFVPEFFIDNLEQQNPSTVSSSHENWIDWNWTNTLSYMKTFNKKHNLNVMAGYTVERFQDYQLYGSRDDVPSSIEEMRYINAGTTNQQVSGVASYNSLVSYLGRLMYNYDERYYLTASVRVDGSSKFPSGSKYATFPSVSGAWRISGENFMKNQKVFDDLKLRLGWGKVGNQNISNDAYISSVGTTRYVFGTDATTTVGTAVNRIGNTQVRWETVEDFNIGVDMAFLKNRLKVTADWYTKKSHDMLMQKENLLVLGLPAWNGRMWENIGSMKATGWELGFNWQDQIKDFTYGASLNLSSVRNKAVNLNGNYIYTGSHNGDYIIRNEEGLPISQFYGYVVDGLFQNQTEVTSYTNEYGEAMQPNAQPGDFRYKDINLDGKIDENDKTYIGNPFPDLMVGFNLNAAYKGFDFQAQFYGTFGNDIYNLNKERYFGLNGSNVLAGTLHAAWHGEGTSYDIPRLSVDDPNGNYTKPSSYFVESGSYFRCKLLQIGYTLPKSVMGNVQLRVSLSAQNLFTITGYSGMDPETASMGSATEAGIDWTGYPNPRTILLGLNLNF
ncbi:MULTISPECIES: SusC/RagA family TonB-linked outer membrane protein [Segatella]|uniref:SusC/RagA family TonB-linked outer membrane protein n=1 Tax=Segatella bryantii TaxID=77095 RepID=A0AA37HYW3_SEGBR|nr:MULTISPECIES: TonB-dependent receptor [Segatella]GJG28472.1 SusC/RagA family TonB-linked outer membrane protein [Segatella bryantii]SER02310.1 TonB-linked outer membrane protein, SusC/RagA family [Segatella baroniae B14]